MLIYYTSRTHPGCWLHDTDGTGDYGGTGNPSEATRFKSKRECNQAIAKCARAWHASADQFQVFKPA